VVPASAVSSPPVAAPEIAPAAVTFPLQELVGLEPDTVADRLGQPTDTDRSALSLVWTYASAECSLSLFFYPHIESAEFYVLKYAATDQTGAEVTDTNSCMQSIVEGPK